MRTEKEIRENFIKISSKLKLSDLGVGWRDALEWVLEGDDWEKEDHIKIYACIGCGQCSVAETVQDKNEGIITIYSCGAKSRRLETNPYKQIPEWCPRRGK